MHAHRFNSIVHFTTPDKTNGINIPSPASGKVLPIDVDDPANAGDGVKIRLEGQRVASPINGDILEISPCHGKVLIQAKNKLRLLIYLPFEYGEFHGLGINPKVAEGHSVKKGQTLLELDLFKIQRKLKPADLYVVLLSTDVFKQINVPHKYVECACDTLFSLIPYKKK